MSLLRDKLKTAAKIDNSEGTVRNNIKTGVTSFWFPDADVDYYFTPLGVGEIFQEHKKDGLCHHAYYGEKCPFCGLETEWETTWVDKKTGEQKSKVKLSKPDAVYRCLAYVHNYAPDADGNPVMITARNGKDYPANPVKVVQLMCGALNTSLSLKQNRHVEHILKAEEQGYSTEAIFCGKREKLVDPKTKKEKIGKATPIEANKRDILTRVVSTKEGTKEIKTPVSKLVVPQDILDKYGKDAMTEGEQIGLVFNTIPGDIRWAHFEEMGVIKPIDPDAEESEEVNGTSDAENEMDN